MNDITSYYVLNTYRPYLRTVSADKMPCLTILTNIPKTKIPRDFVDKMIPLLAKAVKKEEYKFMCVITGDCQMSFGGDSIKPSATATLESIGNLGSKENITITREISAFLQKEINVHPDNFFLTFYDLLPQNVAKGGVTVEEMLQ